MLDDIIELIVEILIDGGAEMAVDAIGSKKVPLVIRIILAVVLGLFLLAFLVLFAWLLIGGIIDKNLIMTIVGGITTVLYAVLLVLLFLKIKKRC